MELVFGPNLRTAEEALYMVKDLTIILKLLGVCSCRMTGNNNIIIICFYIAILFEVLLQLQYTSLSLD